MITLHIDGSCFPNPNHVYGIGVIIKTEIETKKISKKFQSENLVSSNFAEYAALYEALKYLLSENLQNETIRVYGDSQIVMNQCGGTWKKDPRGLYATIAHTCYELLSQFPHISFAWIPREQNMEADRLAQRNGGTPILGPCDDLMHREYQLAMM